MKVEFAEKKFEKIFEDMRWDFYQKGRTINQIAMLQFFCLEEEKFKNYLDQLLSSEKKGDYQTMLAEYIRLYIKGREDDYSKRLLKNVSTFLEKIPDIDVSKITLRPKPAYMKNAKLNSGFRDRIVSDVPKEFNNFEKAFYLFIKLCHILSHDEADLSDKVNYTINHKDINRLQEVDENNNIIVCYEWIVILALFFELFDIPYEITGDEKYGRWHLGINVLYDNVLINFEATLGITCCDLTRIKNNIEAGGISPVQSCTQEEAFKIISSMGKVYKYLEERENKRYYLEHEIIQQEREKIGDLSNLSNSQKIQMFMEKIILSPHKNIVDNIKYMQIWQKILFSKDNTLSLSNILMKDFQENQSDYKVGVLLSFQSDDQCIEYFVYSKQYGFQRIMKEQFVSYLDNSIIEFIDEKDKVEVSSLISDQTGQNKCL